MADSSRRDLLRLFHDSPGTDSRTTVSLHYGSMQDDGVHKDFGTGNLLKNPTNNGKVRTRNATTQSAELWRQSQEMACYFIRSLAKLMKYYNENYLLSTRVVNVLPVLSLSSTTRCQQQHVDKIGITLTPNQTNTMKTRRYWSNTSSL